MDSRQSRTVILETNQLNSTISSFDVDAFLNHGGGGRTQAEQDSLTQLKKKQEMGGSES